MSTPTTNDILEGIRMFMRFQTLEVPFHQLEWTASVEDLLDALSIINQCFQSTANLECEQVRQISTYNYLDDVKQELEEFLLVGETPKETAQKRRKNLSMYHLVIEPIVNSFEPIGHSTALERIERVVQQYVQYVNDFDDFGDTSDGLVAKIQIAALVSQREEARKQTVLNRKKQARAKLPVLEVIVEE